MLFDAWGRNGCRCLEWTVFLLFVCQVFSSIVKEVFFSNIRQKLIARDMIIFLKGR